MSKADIVRQLKAITDLEKIIETRIINGLLPVTDTWEVTLTKDAIKDRVRSLADELIADTSIDYPVLVSVMDGALPFASAMQRTLEKRGYRFQYTTMQSTSYVGTVSSDLSLSFSPKIELAGRTVIIVEDVIDTGKTYLKIKESFEALGATVFLMALVDKDQARPAGAAAHYCGFTISKDAFILGEGLDYDGLCRNVRGIFKVDVTTLPTAKEKIFLQQKKDLSKALQTCIAEERAATSPATSRHSMFAAASASIPTTGVTAAQAYAEGTLVSNDEDADDAAAALQDKENPYHNKYGVTWAK